MKVRLRGILEAVENPAPNRNQIISAPRAPVKASGPRKKTPRISIVIMPGPASTIERTVDELIPFRSTMEVFAVGFNKATRSRVDAYLPITWRRTFDEALPSMRGDLVVFLVEGDRLFPETVAFLPSTPSGPILFSSRPAFCDQDGTVTDILDAPLLQATDEPWAQRASCLFPRKRLQSLPKPLREVVPNGTWFHKVIAHLNGKTDRIRFIDLCTGATCLSASKGSMSFRNRQCLPAIMHQRQALIKKRRIQSPRLPSTMLSENFAFHIRRQQEQAACLHEAHIRRRWTDLGREMQGKRGAILGAGKWTDWLLSVTAQLSPSPCISYILDDNPRFDALKGIPVARLDEVPVDSCDFIILGSDSITHELRNRVNRSKMSNKQMITLYDEVGTPGPFPKATCSTTNHSAKGNQT